MVVLSGSGLPADVEEFRASATARLGAFPHLEVPDDPGIRRAAVLLCVAASPDGRPAVIVIRRAYRGRNAGQWGLPGGRLDPGETPSRAAIRELHEELALTAAPTDIIGRLDDFPAASGFVISPFVAALADIKTLTPSPDEVHSVHFIDLERLAAEDVPHWVHPEHAVRQDDLPAETPPPIAPGHGLLQMRFAPDMTIHAPTGAMLWQFREVLLLGRDPAEARIADFAQPDWTRH
ncbi:NUDIX hydrolase [Nocardia bovistercoris]|uniref:CoA pyrophosphatase n=1 Tax=Nocardia bovistercoris TaxID=2785916 RepID=A0A931N3T1_9NOCA|nr:CoA pyrophosphatase [Nocardia bovistercoris]MBH0778129.1 CoA pyrophosphatase [Nocardia bovistercoris]